jgi:hypothetical protein
MENQTRVVVGIIWIVVLEIGSGLVCAHLFRRRGGKWFNGLLLGILANLWGVLIAYIWYRIDAKEKSDREFNLAVLQSYEAKARERLKPEEAVSSHDIPTTQLVEDIVKSLRQKPPRNEICYVALFGDRPLTGKAQGNESDIMCFTQMSKAEEFIHRYQGFYLTTEPLSVLALGKFSELWAMLNNKAQDKRYEPPYGLLINFNYSGQAYNRYSIADLNRIGLEGLVMGFSALSR